MVAQMQDVTLHDVWRSNLYDEFVQLRKMAEEYSFVAMDTEFPGIVNGPMGQFCGAEGFNYQLFIANVNSTKLIQVGLALVNDRGELPPTKDVWQFNFHFNTTDDMSHNDSISMLRSAGLDFSKHQTEGIAMEDFGELLTTSGLVVNKEVTWITFHSCFDFGYLLRCLFYGSLPEDEREFFRLHHALWPTCYDIKILLREPGPQQVRLSGRLQEVGDQLQVTRIGQPHQAGSDALLTAMTFFKLKERFFTDSWEEISKRVCGQMFGISQSTSGISSLSHLANSAALAAAAAAQTTGPVSYVIQQAQQNHHQAAGTGTGASVNRQSFLTPQMLPR